jgi:hypothetical protein
MVDVYSHALQYDDSPVVIKRVLVAATNVHRTVLRYEECMGEGSCSAEFGLYDCGHWLLAVRCFFIGCFTLKGSKQSLLLLLLSMGRSREEGGKTVRPRKVI